MKLYLQNVSSNAETASTNVKTVSADDVLHVSTVPTSHDSARSDISEVGPSAVGGNDVTNMAAPYYSR